MRAIAVLVLAVLVCGCASEVGSVEGEQRAVDAGQLAPDAGPAVTQEGTPATSDAGVAPDAAPMPTDPATASADDAGPDAGAATAPDAAMAVDAAPDAPPAVADASPPPSPPPPGVSLTWENECEREGTSLPIDGVVQNTGSATVNAADVLTRFWFLTREDFSTFGIAEPAVGASAVIKRMSTPTKHADSYVEISYAARDVVPGTLLADGSYLPSGMSVVSIYEGGPGGAWSYQVCNSDFNVFAPWNRVGIYVSGYLVWGVEPTPATDP